MRFKEQPHGPRRLDNWPSSPIPQATAFPPMPPLPSPPLFPPVPAPSPIAFPPIPFPVGGVPVSYPPVPPAPRMYPWVYPAPWYYVPLAERFSDGWPYPTNMNKYDYWGGTGFNARGPSFLQEAEDDDDDDDDDE